MLPTPAVVHDAAVIDRAVGFETERGATFARRNLDCRGRRIWIGNGRCDRCIVARIRPRADIAGVGRARDTRYAAGETAVAERLDLSVPGALYAAAAAVVVIQRQTDPNSEFRRLPRLIAEVRPDQRHVGEIHLAIAEIGAGRRSDDRRQAGNRWVTRESPSGIRREIGTRRSGRAGPSNRGPDYGGG